MRGIVLHTTRGDQRISPAQIETMTSLLSDLRGLAVKIGQWLAEEDDLLPGEVTAALARSYRDVVPMHDSEVESVFRRDFASSPEHMFERFDRTPFAAASIGQVHEAFDLHHGRLAVKVQYPGLADTIRSDLRVLRGAMTLVPWARRHRATLDEISARFAEELDYRREAENLRVFRRRLSPMGVEIPAVVEELSSARVLTMGRLGGQPICAWAKSAGPKAIDRVASVAYAVWNAGVTEHGSIHGDPSPGNLLVEDDRLQIVDLGCTRAISPPVAALMRTLLEAPELAGSGATLSIYRELGVIKAGAGARLARSSYEASLAPLERWLVGPARAGGLDFRAASDWPVRGRDCLARLVRQDDALDVHREFVLLFRAYYALFRLFQHIGAHVTIIQAGAT